MYAVVSCCASLLGSCLCTGFFTFTKAIMVKARAGYCFLFTLSIIVSWILRDYAKQLLDKIPCKYKKNPFFSTYLYKLFRIALSFLLRSLSDTCIHTCVLDCTFAFTTMYVCMYKCKLGVGRFIGL